MLVLLGSSIIRNFIVPELNVMTYVNLGLSRLLSADLLSKSYLKKIRSLTNPTRFVIYIGNNDIRQGIPPDKIIENMRVFIEILSTMYPSAEIIVLSILKSPANIRDKLVSEIDIVNRGIKKQKNILFLNVTRQLSNAKYYKTEDGLHLTSEGYAKLWLLIEKYL